MVRENPLLKRALLIGVLLALFGVTVCWLRPCALALAHVELGGRALDAALAPVFADRLAPAQVVDGALLQEGMAHLQKALLWDPDDVQARRLLARGYLSQGTPEAALAVLQEAVCIRPEALALHLELGDVYDALGQSKLALEAYEKGRIGSRSLPAAANCLKLAEANLQHPDYGGEKTITFWYRALDLDPTNLYVLTRLYDVHLALGDQAQVAQYAESLQALEPCEVSLPLDTRLAAYQGEALVSLVESGFWERDEVDALLACQQAQVTDTLSALMFEETLRVMLAQWPEDAALLSLAGTLE